MANYVVRAEYLDKIREFREKKLIKVITGVRRCGKSVLLEQIQEELRSGGVQDGQIISLNFEKLENEELLDYKKLHDYISQRLFAGGFTYIFLDEIQMVKDFQKAVDSLYTKQMVDVYITGSNSCLLSGELATLMTGRYVTLHVMPLSFKEYLQSKTGATPAELVRMQVYNIDFKKELGDYMRLGAFPQTLELESQRAIYSYLDSVYNTVVVKDILARGKTVNEGVLTSLTKFLFHNIGSEVSSVNITNTLRSNKREVSYNTVEKYLGYLKDSFIIYEAGRFDVKGKQHLKTNAKYYAVDSGLRNMMLANREIDIGHVLENIVYLELLRRGFKVSVGKFDSKEIDFVAQNEKETIYFQVAASLLDENTLKRELVALNSINDHCQKFVVTLDDFTAGNNYNGIRIIHAIDFLLGN